MSKGLSYRDAGVDIVAGDALVETIKPFARRTMRPEVLAGIGGFGALMELPKKYRQPVLVSGTDGVGTKLKLAFMLGRHDTVGIDLVAMSVNDVLVQGAEPLFFLDYFACGKLDTVVAASVIKGIAQGCWWACDTWAPRTSRARSTASRLTPSAGTPASEHAAVGARDLSPARAHLCRLRHGTQR